MLLSRFTTGVPCSLLFSRQLLREIFLLVRAKNSEIVRDALLWAWRISLVQCFIKLSLTLCYRTFSSLFGRSKMRDGPRTLRLNHSAKRTTSLDSTQSPLCVRAMLLCDTVSSLLEWTPSGPQSAKQPIPWQTISISLSLTSSHSIAASTPQCVENLTIYRSPSQESSLHLHWAKTARSYLRQHQNNVRLVSRRISLFYQLPLSSNLHKTVPIWPESKAPTKNSERWSKSPRCTCWKKALWKRMRWLRYLRIWLIS